MPRAWSVATDRSTLWAGVLGMVAIGLLVGFVVVLNQGVERGNQIRAALAAPALASVGVAGLNRR